MTPASTPIRTAGTTIAPTSGMTSALTKGDTSDCSAKTLSVTGASPSVTATCTVPSVRSLPIHPPLLRAGRVASAITMTATATNDSQNPGARTLWGSTASTVHQRDRERVRRGHATLRQPRREHHREHQQRPLRGQREAGEQRVAERRDHRRDPRNLRRRDQQRGARQERPCTSRHHVGGTRRHPDVQPRDRHQVGDAGDPKRPPALLRDTAPISDGQGAHQPFAAVSVECGTNRPGHVGPKRVHSRQRQGGSGTDATPGLDVAGGDDPACEQSALVVGAAGIVPSARLSQPDRQSPYRPGSGHRAGAVPGEPDPSSGGNRRVGAVVDVEIEPDPACADLRQAPHGAGDFHVRSLHRGRKRRSHLHVGEESRPHVSRRHREQGTRPDLRERKPHGDRQRRTPHRIRQRGFVLEHRHPDDERTGECQHV